MEKTYWLRRKRAAMAMARAAATSESRLIHYEMAGRYSIRAAHARERVIAAATPCACVR
jgi:hypothetical protein